jgi:thiamine-monophosphate kinase
MIDGVARLADHHRIHVAGGNLTRSPGPLVIDVTAIGSVKRRSVLTRRGARPGDEWYVTGTIGGAFAGLQQLRAGESMGPAPTSCVRRFLYPEPRVRAGVLLGRNRAATACMDLSDGLADAIRQIAEQSSVGVIIDPAALPIEPDCKAWFEQLGADPVSSAIAGGDDYELAFTASPRLRGRLRAVERHGQVAVTRIGVCTRERDLVVRGATGDRRYETALPQGFSHFR